MQSPWLGPQVGKNKAVGQAAERQYRVVKELTGATVVRTGRGSDFAVTGLFASVPRLVDIKTGKAVLSSLQKAMGAEAVYLDPFLNSALAMVGGAAGGVALAEGIKRLAHKHIRLNCGACGHRATMDHHHCPVCGERLARRIEFWVAIGLLVVGGVIALVDRLRLGLDLALNLLAGALLGAGLDLLLDSLSGFRARAPRIWSRSAICLKVPKTSIAKA